MVVKTELDLLYDTIIKIAEESNCKRFKYKNYNCMVLRMWDFHLNGYIEIKKGHKLYEVHYDKINNIEVHGGFTFSGTLDDKYYIGFDCAHAWDYIPSILHNYNMYDFYISRIDRFTNEVYRTEKYVIKECKNVVRQIIEKYDSKI